MACTNTDRFVINKGLSNEFILTIKQNDSTLPMVIDPSDTFILKIFNIETNELIATITQTDSLEGIITTHEASTGKINVVLKAALTDTLESTRGSKADRYYLSPTYRISIDSSTEANGNFVAKIPFVYVE